jgi:hypothetical protein
MNLGKPEMRLSVEHVTEPTPAPPPLPSPSTPASSTPQSQRNS